jgi:hypothetical protein
MSTIKSIIPSQPGFFLVEADHDQNGNITGSFLKPIIGWQVAEVGFDDGGLPVDVLKPVTVTEVCDDPCPVVHYSVTGAVYAFGTDWDSLEQWLAHAKSKQTAEQRERVHDAPVDQDGLHE